MDIVGKPSIPHPSPSFLGIGTGTNLWRKLARTYGLHILIISDHSIWISNNAYHAKIAFSLRVEECKRYKLRGPFSSISDAEAWLAWADLLFHIHPS